MRLPWGNEMIWKAEYSLCAAKRIGLLLVGLFMVYLGAMWYMVSISRRRRILGVSIIVVGFFLAVFGDMWFFGVRHIPCPLAVEMILESIAYIIQAIPP